MLEYNGSYGVEPGDRASVGDRERNSLGILDRVIHSNVVVRKQVRGPDKRLGYSDYLDALSNFPI